MATASLTSHGILTESNHEVKTIQCSCITHSTDHENTVNQFHKYTNRPIKINYSK